MKYFATILFFSILLANNRVYAQYTFEKTFGGAGMEYGYAIHVTDDGEYLIGGGSESFTEDSSRIAYLVKVDNIGGKIWSRIYNFNYESFGSIQDIQSTKDGGYLLCGYSGILKINSFGDSIWAITTPRFESMVQCPDSTYILSTDVWKGGANHDIGLLKINQQGDTVGSKIYDKDRTDRAVDMTTTSDTNYILLARYSDANNLVVWLLKFDEMGDTIWTKSYPGNSSLIGLSVQETYDKGFIILGSTYYSYTLIKTDANGNLQWEKVYDFPSDGLPCYSVQQTYDGGFIFAGKSFVDTVITNGLCLVRTDEHGDTLWVRQYDNGFGLDLKITDDNGFVLGGFSNWNDYKQLDFYLLKTDANGYAKIDTNKYFYNDQLGSSNLMIYPNPTNGEIFIIGAFKEVEVINIFGCIIMQTNKRYIDFSSLPSGIFILKFIDDNGNIYIRRLMKS